MASDQIITALIAGSVSIVIGAATFGSAMLGLRAKVREYERQIANKYQERLYEKRLELYPVAFSITHGINFPPKNWTSFERSDMLDKRDQLVAWLNSQAGLIISTEVISASRELIRALSPNYGLPDAYHKAQLENIIETAVALRRELRRDVLVFHRNDLSRQIGDV